MLCYNISDWKSHLSLYQNYASICEYPFGTSIHSYREFKFYLYTTWHTIKIIFSRTLLIQMLPDSISLSLILIMCGNSILSVFFTYFVNIVTDLFWNNKLFIRIFNYRGDSVDQICILWEDSTFVHMRQIAPLSSFFFYFSFLDPLSSP